MAGDLNSKPAPSLEPFASPDKIDPLLKSFLEDASSLLCDWVASAGQRGPLPSTISVIGEVGPRIEGLSSEALLQDLKLIMDGSFQPSHPGSLAHLDPPPLTSSIVADLICAGLNNNLLAEELSPSLSRLEKELCKWFAETIGMPPGSGGVAASGGSLSNLMALVMARNYADLINDPSAVVFISADAHVCFDKAIKVMGLFSDSLQKVPTNEKGMIDITLLKNKLAELRSKGRKCFAIVATAGTTVRGAIDPINKLSELCKEENIWLHVDGAVGGIFSISNNTKEMLHGISNANSITLNPQKLLGIAKTSSLLLVSDQRHLSTSFATGLPYIQEPLNGEINRGEIGLQGTRPAEILKLWIGLRHLGEKGIDSLLQNAIERRTFFQRRLNNSRLKILTGKLHIISCTCRSADHDISADWSAKTRINLLANKFMLSRPMHQGRYYLKAVMGNPHTRNHHLEKLATFLNESMEDS